MKNPGLPVGVYGVQNRRAGAGDEEFPVIAGFERRTYRALPWVLHVFAPLVLGGVIYALYRSPDLLVFDWLRAFGLDPPAAWFRFEPQGSTAHLPAGVVFSLPDGLWVYALTAAMSLLWRDRPGRVGALWLSSGLVLGLGIELAQSLGRFPGTFDPYDMLAAGVAFPIALWFTHPSRHIHRYQRNRNERRNP